MIQTHEMGNKLISLPKKPPTPDHIGDVFKSPLRFYWYDSIFSNNDKTEKSNTFGAPFMSYSLPVDTKIIRPGIYFRVNTNGI